MNVSLGILKKRANRGDQMQPPQYDVIIVGAGPAGIFAALELSEKNDFKVLMLEKGPDISARRCLMKENGACVRCNPCSIVSGWGGGGAGAFSDGKLTLTTDFGGWLDEYMDRSTVAQLIKYVDSVYLSFGAPEHVLAPIKPNKRNTTPSSQSRP